MPPAIIILVLSLIGLATIVINMATLWVMFNCRRLRKPANFPIFSFLITGLLQGFVVIPVYCVKRLDLATSPDWVCDLFRFPYFLCGHMLTLSILLVALERFAAIRFTFRYHDLSSARNMLLIISTVWIVVLTIDVLPFVNGAKLDKKCKYFPWKKWSIAVLVLTIVIPMIIIVVCYACIWRTAVKHAERIQSSCSGRKNSKRKRYASRMELKATKTSLLLIGIFFFTWAPIGIYYLVENICGDCITHSVSSSMQEDFRFWVKVISYTSCIFSPLAYCWRTREFRSELNSSIQRRSMKAPAIAIRFAQRLSKEKNVVGNEQSINTSI